MNHLTKVRIAYECSILGIILSIFLKSLYPSVMQTAGMVTLIVLLIPVFVWQEALYDSRFIMIYILPTGMFLGVKLAVYAVEYAIYKSRRWLESNHTIVEILQRSNVEL